MQSCCCTLPLSACKNCPNNQTYNTHQLVAEWTEPQEYYAIDWQKEAKKKMIRDLNDLVQNWK